MLILSKKTYILDFFYLILQNTLKTFHLSVIKYFICENGDFTLFIEVFKIRFMALSSILLTRSFLFKLGEL